MPFSSFFQFIDKALDAQEPAASAAAQVEKNTLQSHASIVKEVLSDLKLGDKPDEETKEKVSWVKRHGSAALLISVYVDDKSKELMVEIIAPMVKYPIENVKPDVQTASIFHLLLDLNYHLADARLAWSEEWGIVMIARRRALGLDKSEFVHMLKVVSTNADRIDTLLARDFDVQMWGSDGEISF